MALGRTCSTALFRERSLLLQDSSCRICAHRNIAALGIWCPNFAESWEVFSQRSLNIGNAGLINHLSSPSSSSERSLSCMTDSWWFSTDSCMTDSWFDRSGCHSIASRGLGVCACSESTWLTASKSEVLMTGLNLRLFLIDSLSHTLPWVTVVRSGTSHESLLTFARKSKLRSRLMSCKSHSNLFMGDGSNFTIAVLRFSMSACLGCSLTGSSTGSGFSICIPSVSGDLRLQRNDTPFKFLQVTLII